MQLWTSVSEGYTGCSISILFTATLPSGVHQVFTVYNIQILTEHLNSRYLSNPVGFSFGSQIWYFTFHVEDAKYIVCAGYRFLLVPKCLPLLLLGHIVSTASLSAFSWIQVKKRFEYPHIRERERNSIVVQSMAPNWVLKWADILCTCAACISTDPGFVSTDPTWAIQQLK